MNPNTMTREDIIALTGEDPVDMFGEDWENEVAVLLEDIGNQYEPKRSSA